MTTEDAIRGLMLLGRTREQAECEVRKCEDRRFEQMCREWWGSYDRKGR